VCARKLAILFALQNNSSIERYLVPYAFVRTCTPRICPAAFLQATQREAMHKIFEEASNGIVPASLDLLDILRCVADDVAPSEVGSGSSSHNTPSSAALLDQLLGVPLSTRTGTRSSRRLLPRGWLYRPIDFLENQIASIYY